VVEVVLIFVGVWRVMGVGLLRFLGLDHRYLPGQSTWAALLLGNSQAFRCVNINSEDAAIGALGGCLVVVVPFAFLYSNYGACPSWAWATRSW